MSSTGSRRRPATQPVPGRDDVALADAQLVSYRQTGMPASARMLYAVVHANGILVRGLGAASATRLAPGMYQVVFDQDVSRAGYVGTIGLAGSAGLAPPGGISVVGRTGIPNGVFVKTFAIDGSVSDRPFHLAVLA
ncbi:hypothetical protein AB0B63_24210 [Micromonospora sp. NPDC049081]|uniref:hypothetical protein n=1 Tax=Micromonospora sp. NPDC049081 TaxID=3155150 RepID=UPI003406EDE8